MIFNSLEFAIFLPIVFFIYWFLNNNLKIQNLFILFVSYFFYGYWNLKFLPLIIFSSFVDYSIGIIISKTEQQKYKKYFLLISIFINLSLLFYFKYFNFFIESFASSFLLFGTKLNIYTLNIILPVGISFYTFQTMSYTIDIYKGKMKPTTNIIDFFAYVSFFPQLVAGPIERAINLLSQFQNKRELDYEQVMDGSRQILWGLFKKSVVADNCNNIIIGLFENPANYSGINLFFGTILFAIQIYCDFSGYSDIAIGSAKLLNFRLMKNFNYPFFSKDFSDFWKRWHISLTTWVRDYIYLPLGGNKNKLRNNTIVFILIGLWHGANLTFIAWGLLMTIYYLPVIYKSDNINPNKMFSENKVIFRIKEFIKMITTFILFSLSAVFFRADNINQSYIYIKSMFSLSLLSLPNIIGFKIILIISILFLFEWFNRDKEYPLLSGKNSFILSLKVIFIYFMIFFFGAFIEKDFIYFQF